MDNQEETWRVRADSLAVSQSFRFDEAVDLLTTILRTSRDPLLTDAAKQALPSIRAAASPNTSTFSRDVARRRFDAVRQELNNKGAARFGRRSANPPPPPALSEAALADQAYRKLLGLPTSGRLFGPDIKAAYRRTARASHPDMGGDIATFVELVAARDALLAKL